MNIAERLQSLLGAGVEGGAFPSAVAVVGIGCEPLAAACAGHIRLGGPPANLETRYDMASVTKILVPTMLALRAVEEGALTLADTVSQFFGAPPDKRDITVRQLMTHTGGFAPHFDLAATAKTPEHAVSAILAHPLAETPGDMPRYSCMGYILLGKMLEALYGDSLDVLAQKHVFEPLGMARTSYCPAGGNIAATEVDPATGEAITGIVHDENARFLGGVSANAGVFSDIRDMIRFASMLAKGGDGYLSPATLRAATQNRTPGCDTHRGLGFQLGGTWGCFLGELLPEAAYGHTGFTGTSIAIDPATGFFAVLLTNRVHPTRDNHKILRFRRAFHNALYAAACGM